MPRIERAVYRQKHAPVYPWRMTASFPLRCALVLACCVLAACQTSRRPDPLPAQPGDWRSGLVGEFDNHEQVYQAQPASLPRVHFKVDAIAQADWYAWRTQLRGQTLLEASWLLRTVQAQDGSFVLTPHRPLVANAATDRRFDAKQWVALDACALRGTLVAGGLQATADPAACATVAPGIGVEAALLPLSIESRGETLQVRLYADQARGAAAKSTARRVQWFAGWAAINGAGANATAESGDWHMQKDLRIGSEGGRVALAWRDGKLSGYSLQLERLTYRDGNMPVLKLSLVEDAGDRTLVYAWANPEATSIGLNLGWVQVGLSREAAATAPVPRN